jgi:hypothetical protein
LGNTLGGMGKIAIHPDDHVVSGSLDPFRKRNGQTMIFHAADDLHTGWWINDLRSYLPGPIGGIIVNDEDFNVVNPVFFNGVHRGLDQSNDVACLVKGWHDYRNASDFALQGIQKNLIFSANGNLWLGGAVNEEIIEANIQTACDSARSNTQSGITASQAVVIGQGNLFPIGIKG